MIRTAAEREEEIELKNLRDQADQSVAEAAQTLAELNRRLRAGHPKVAARRLASGARVTALRVFREGPGNIAGQRGARRLALAAIPVILIAAALAYAASQGKLRS